MKLVLIQKLEAPMNSFHFCLPTQISCTTEKPAVDQPVRQEKEDYITPMPI